MISSSSMIFISLFYRYVSHNNDERTHIFLSGQTVVILSYDLSGFDDFFSTSFAPVNKLGSLCDSVPQHDRAGFMPTANKSIRKSQVCRCKRLLLCGICHYLFVRSHKAARRVQSAHFPSYSWSSLILSRVPSHNAEPLSLILPSFTSFQPLPFIFPSTSLLLKVSLFYGTAAKGK